MIENIYIPIFSNLFILPKSGRKIILRLPSTWVWMIVDAQMVLGSFRHLTFRQWTFRRRHFGSLDVSAHVRFGTADISTHGRYGTGLFRHRDISARGTFRHMDVSAPWTFRHMDISARQTFRHVDISAPWTFRHVDISARWTFRHGDFSTLDFLAQVFSAHFRSGIF